MKIVFFGTPQFAIPTLTKLLAEPQVQVLGAVTQPDKIRGRGNKVMPSPVKELATAHQLPIWQPHRIKKDPDTIANLRALEADLFIVIAYGQILSQEILDLPKLGCINVHGSLLPAYRGAAPIQRCLTDGVKVTGITTMLMDAGMDTGAMLLKCETPVDLFDNADRLAVKLADLGADLLLETILTLDRITPTPQDDTAATYAPPIQKTEYQIDWTRSSLEIHHQVRGFYPNCATILREQPLKISATIPLTDEVQAELPPKVRQLLPELTNLEGDLTPGTVVKIAKGLGAIVVTGSGFILITEGQLPGKKPQSGVDLINGTRLMVGERLGAPPIVS